MYLDTLSLLATLVVLGISALLIINNEGTVADKVNVLFRHRARRPHRPADE